MNKLYFFPCALVIASQTLPTQVLAEANKIPTIVVTTNNRYQQNINDVINSTTLITRQDIDELQPSTTSELLDNVVGINVSSNGGKGTVTAVFLQGLKAGKEVSVLIDGVAVPQSGTDSFAWGSIDPDMIERIEIVRGITTTTYGTGGVGTINIITRQKEHASIKLSYGSYGTRKQVVSVGGKQNNSFGFSATVVREKSTGFSATNEKNGNFDSDKDEYSNNNASIKAWAKPSKYSKFSLAVFDSRTKVGFDSGSYAPPTYTLTTDTIPDFYNVNQSLFSLQFEQIVNNVWNFSVKHAASKYASTHTGSSSYGKVLSGDQNNFVNNFSFSSGKLTIGNDFVKNVTVSGYTTGDPNKTLKTNTYFSKWNGKLAAFSYGIGYRDTIHNVFGHFQTKQLGIAYNITNNFKIKANTGSFTKAPNSYQLNGDGGVWVLSNPQLTTQTTTTQDLGLNYADETITSEISFYTTSITNPISFKSKKYSNGENTNFTGTDFSYKQVFGNTNAKFTATILNYQDKSTNKPVLKRPDKYGLLIQHKLDVNSSLGLKLLRAEKSYDYKSWPKITQINAYSLVHLTYTHKLNKNLSLGFKIENLSDEVYENTYGYNTPRRSYSLSLEFKPNTK